MAESENKMLSKMAKVGNTGLVSRNCKRGNMTVVKRDSILPTVEVQRPVDDEKAIVIETGISFMMPHQTMI